MSEHRPPFDWLTDGIAAVFRIGTLVAMGIVAIGYLTGVVIGKGEGGRPFVDQLSGGGSVAIIAVGLLVLTLLPVAVVAAASIGFAQSGERRRLMTALLVLALLLASIVTAAVIVPAG
jgi:uncharacterized membrane protein